VLEKNAFSVAIKLILPWFVGHKSLPIVVCFGDCGLVFGHEKVLLVVLVW